MSSAPRRSARSIPALQRLHSLMLLVDQDENPAQVEPCQGLVEGVAPVLCQLKGKLGR